MPDRVRQIAMGRGAHPSARTQDPQEADASLGRFEQGVPRLALEKPPGHGGWAPRAKRRLVIHAGVSRQAVDRSSRKAQLAAELPAYRVADKCTGISHVARRSQAGRPRLPGRHQRPWGARSLQMRLAQSSRCRTRHEQQSGAGRRDLSSG